MIPDIDPELLSDQSGVEVPGDYVVKHEDVISRSVIQDMCRGDHRAFRRVYLHTIGPLTDFLEILLRSKHEAEEIAQELFTYIWENISKIDPEKNFKGYLYTVAKNLALKQMARKKVERKYYDYKINAFRDFNLSPDEIVMNDELALLINIYITNLPPQRKRVFELSRIEGKSVREIAEELNLSANTVKTHLKLAKRGFKDLIGLAVALFFS